MDNKQEHREKARSSKYVVLEKNDADTMDR